MPFNERRHFCPLRQKSKGFPDKLIGTTPYHPHLIATTKLTPFDFSVLSFGYLDSVIPLSFVILPHLPSSLHFSRQTVSFPFS
jgi:hypothetical protein